MEIGTSSVRVQERKDAGSLEELAEKFMFGPDLGREGARQFARHFTQTIILIILHSKYFYLHFTDKETDTQIF